MLLLACGLGMLTAQAAERPVVTIKTVGYAILEECPADAARDTCFNEDVALPLRINIGDEIRVDIARVGEVVDYYVNALWHDPESGSCRATSNTTLPDNAVWVLIIELCEVVN